MMGDINFREFYSKCKFYFLMEGNANFLRKYSIPFDLNARLDQLRLEGACI